eukprot:6285533-Amphidinium_carterae.1
MGDSVGRLGRRPVCLPPNRSFETIPENEEGAHGPHHLEPAPWERTLEAVVVELEVCDCALEAIP